MSSHHCHQSESESTPLRAASDASPATASRSAPPPSCLSPSGSRGPDRSAWLLHPCCSSSGRSCSLASLTSAVLAVALLAAVLGVSASLWRSAEELRARVNALEPAIQLLRQQQRQLQLELAQRTEGVANGERDADIDGDGHVDGDADAGNTNAAEGGQELVQDARSDSPAHQPRFRRRSPRQQQRAAADEDTIELPGGTSLKRSTLEVCQVEFASSLVVSDQWHHFRTSVRVQLIL